MGLWFWGFERCLGVFLKLVTEKSVLFLPEFVLTDTCKNFSVKISFYISPVQDASRGHLLLQGSFLGVKKGEKKSFF